jgi:cytochrome P450
MEQLARFDPRLSLFSRAVKNSANPHTVYYDKAKDIRAERIEGVVHLYRMADIVAINRHPSITGTGGRGGTFGNAGALIPLEIDGSDHKKWRRLLDPMFAPKQVARLEESVRGLARELIDGFVENGSVDLAQAFCVLRSASVPDVSPNHGRTHRRLRLLHRVQERRDPPER